MKLKTALTALLLLLAYGLVGALDADSAQRSTVNAEAGR